MPRLVAAIMGTVGAEVNIPTELSAPSGKRPRQLEVGGESAEDTTEKLKGTG